jgi:integrase
VIESIDTTNVTELRNKAILLLGFSGAFRRSELSSLNIEDLQFTDECLITSISKSKTNQYGQAEEKAIFYSPNSKLCPVRTLQRWIAETGRSNGALFVSIKKAGRITDERLTDKTINNIVKQYIGADYSAHSLRASFVTVAKKNGAADSEIMRQT